MSDDQHGEGAPPSGGRWDPLPQGDYDDGATAFVELPEGGIDALLSADSPLAAPGHGYVPPRITAAPGAADPAATGTWALPADGHRWPDPNAVAQDPAADDRFTYQPGATQHWTYEEPAAPAAPGHDVTGQWSIPVAGGDLPDESGEFTTSALVEQWGGTPPATLPGGASAPWATEPPGQPWAQPEQAPHPGAHPGSDPHGRTPAHTGPGAGGHAPERFTPDGTYAGHPGEHLTEHPADRAEMAPGTAEDAAAAGFGRTRAPADGPGFAPAPAGGHDHARTPEGPADGPPGYDGTMGAGFTAPTAPEPAAGAADVDPAHAGTTRAESAHVGPAQVDSADMGPADTGPAGAPADPAVDAEHTPVEHTAVADAPGAEHTSPATEPDARSGHDTPGTPDTGGTGEASDAFAGSEGRPEDDPAAHGPSEDGPAAGTAQTDGPAPDADAGVGSETSGPGAPAAEDGREDAARAPLPPHDDHPLASYVLRVNGADRPVGDAWIGESLLYVLRERLGLAGAKDGCSQGECGACNVQVDGRLVASCLVPAVTAAGSEVRTVEGLAADGRPSDVQRALARCGAVQCGFCVPGMAMTVHDLLEGNPAPTELETRQALCGNLCRCSGYRGVLDAVREVVAEREAHHTAADTETEGDEARIPHQAGPGAGGVHASAFAPAGLFDSPGTFGTPGRAPAPGPHAPHAPHDLHEAHDPREAQDPYDPRDVHDPQDPHDRHYGQDGGQG